MIVLSYQAFGWFYHIFRAEQLILHLEDHLMGVLALAESEVGPEVGLDGLALRGLLDG